MSALFSSPPKPKGPSAESLALQRKQTEALERKEKDEKRKNDSRKKVVAQRRGTRGLGTLFADTGELGVTLGGAGKGSKA